MNPSERFAAVLGRVVALLPALRIRGEDAERESRHSDSADERLEELTENLTKFADDLEASLVG